MKTKRIVSFVMVMVMILSMIPGGTVRAMEPTETMIDTIEAPETEDTSESDSDTESQTTEQIPEESTQTDTESTEVTEVTTEAEADPEPTTETTTEITTEMDIETEITPVMEEVAELESELYEAPLTEDETLLREATGGKYITAVNSVRHSEGVLASYYLINDGNAGMCYMHERSTALEGSALTLYNGADAVNATGLDYESQKKVGLACLYSRFSNYADNGYTGTLPGSYADAGCVAIIGCSVLAGNSNADNATVKNQVDSYVASINSIAGGWYNYYDPAVYGSSFTNTGKDVSDTIGSYQVSKTMKLTGSAGYEFKSTSKLPTGVSCAVTNVDNVTSTSSIDYTPGDYVSLKQGQYLTFFFASTAEIDGFKMNFETVKSGVLTNWYIPSNGSLQPVVSAAPINVKASVSVGTSDVTYPFYFTKKSANPGLTNNNDNYSLDGAQYVLKEGNSYADFIIGKNSSGKVYANTKTTPLVTNASGQLTYTFNYKNKGLTLNQVKAMYSAVDNGDNMVTVTFTTAKPMQMDRGTYKIFETAAPEGYQIDPDCNIHGGEGHSFTISNPSATETITCSEPPTMAPAHFYKQSLSNVCVNNNMYSLAGAEYVLYQYDKDTKTNSTGYIILGYNDSDTAVKAGITKAHPLITNEQGQLTYTFNYVQKGLTVAQVKKLYSAKDNGDGTVTITFTQSRAMQLAEGDYKIYETKAPKGYKLDNKCKVDGGEGHLFTAELFQTKIIVCTEEPEFDPVKLEMVKYDKEYKTNVPLNGAIFEVAYYDGYYNRMELNGQTPSRKWYFKTQNGKWNLTDTPYNDSTYHSDAKYYVNKEEGIPLGTVTIKEVAAPTGYNVTDDANSKGSITVDGKPYAYTDYVMIQFKMNGNNVIQYLDGTTQTQGQEKITFVAKDSKKRGDLSFVKFKLEDGSLMKNIAFIMESVETGEKHIVVTDENGSFDSSAIKDNINGNDRYLDDLENEAIVNNEITSTGIWFYGTADKTKWDNSSIDTTKGSLPYGKYTITEIASKNNEGTRLVKKNEYVFEVTDNGVKPFKLVADSKIPSIYSSSVDNKTSSNYSIPDKNVNITDTIYYDSLAADTDYAVKGILVAREDCTLDNGKSYKAGDLVTDDKNQYIRCTKVFHTASSDTTLYKGVVSGSVDLDYTFDGSSLSGLKAVWFTYLAEGADDNPLEVEDGIINKEDSGILSYKINGETYYVEDAGLDNKKEFVSFTHFESDAWTDTLHNNQGMASKSSVITDTVYLYNLEEDADYQLTTWLVDEKGNPIKGTDGNDCKKITNVPYQENPETKCMDLDVRLPAFDSTQYIGQKVIVFNKLEKDGITYINAQDLEDERESVYYSEIQTTATDENGNKTIPLNKTITIVDMVKYRNVKPELEYTVTGTLHYEDENGKVQTLLRKDGTPVTASTTVTPTEPNGEVSVVFTFGIDDISINLPKEVVVFENMSYDGITFLTHADIKDKGQTVEFPEIEIHTTALSEDTNEHIAGAYKTAKIIDTVAYSGLDKGRKFKLFGTLMDKSTGKPLKVNGEKVTVESKPFIPDNGDDQGHCDGTCDMVFSFDASSIAGKSVVLYEKLYMMEVDEEGKETGKWFVVGKHEDIDDEGQTVHFTDIHTTAMGKDSKSHEVKPADHVTIVDNVSYSNLIVGQKYTVKGILMLVPDDIPEGKNTKQVGDAVYKVNKNLLQYDSDVYVDQNGYECHPLKVDGKPVTAQATFVAKSSNGEIAVEFTFNAKSLGGRSVVVFEDMYYQGVRVGTHADITDEGQTIQFKSSDTDITITTKSKFTGNGKVRTGDKNIFLLFLIIFITLIFATALYAYGHQNVMRKMLQKIKNQKLLLLFLAAGIMTMQAYASGNMTVDKDVKVDGKVYQYRLVTDLESDNPDTQYDFEETYDGARLTDTDYEIIKTTYPLKTDTIQKTYRNLQDDSEIKKTIIQNDVEYKLVDTESKPVKEEAEYTLDYGYQTSAPVPDKTYVYTYTSPVTGKETTARLPLVRLDKGEDGWVDGFTATVTFKNLEGEDFTLGNHTFTYSENLTLTEGDYTELIKMLKLDPALYRLRNFTWDGEAYTGDDNELWRDATVTGQQYASRYSAYYADEIEVGKTVRAVYEAEIEDKDAAPTYTIRATGFYESSKAYMKVVVAGVLLFVVAAVLLIYLFSKKSKKSKKGKEGYTYE